MVATRGYSLQQPVEKAGGRDMSDIDAKLPTSRQNTVIIPQDGEGQLFELDAPHLKYRYDPLYDFENPSPYGSITLRFLPSNIPNGYQSQLWLDSQEDYDWWVQQFPQRYLRSQLSQTAVEPVASPDGTLNQHFQVITQKRFTYQRLSLDTGRVLPNFVQFDMSQLRQVIWRCPSGSRWEISTALGFGRWIPFQGFIFG